MKKMIILGAFRFPDIDAAAKRVYGFGKCFNCNYDIKYLSWGGGDKPNLLQKYNGFEYLLMDEFNNGKGNALQKVKKYIQLGSKTLSWLKKENLENISTIIAYHGTSIFLLRLWILCKKNNITLILDCTEWYDSAHLPGGKYGIVALDNAIRMRLINPLIGKIIVISSFLYKYYHKKVNNIYKVPFLINIKESDISLEIQNKTIKLLYIGNPGKKDKFDVLLESIIFFNKTHKIKISLDIFGLTAEEYIENNNSINLKTIVNNFISFKGRIPNKDVPFLYQHYHFSILLRPNKRYAQAGFPTKLVESLSFGTPMIASDVGDIKTYIINKKSGYLVSSISNIDPIVNIFQEIIKLSNKDYDIMRKEAFEVAKNNFNYRNQDDLLNFIKQCNEK